jgi:hypothetical protein
MCFSVRLWFSAGITATFVSCISKCVIAELGCQKIFARKNLLKSNNLPSTFHPNSIGRRHSVQEWFDSKSRRTPSDQALSSTLMWNFRRSPSERILRCLMPRRRAPVLTTCFIRADCCWSIRYHEDIDVDPPMTNILRLLEMLLPIAGHVSFLCSLSWLPLRRLR